MPYVRCLRCDVTNFTAAHWSSVERCAYCDEPLTRPRRHASVDVRSPLIAAAGDAASGADERRTHARSR